MKYFLTFTTVILLLWACGSNTAQPSRSVLQKNNTVAEELFCGIWMLSDSDTPFLKVTKDSLMFYEQQNSQMAYDIIKDSLIVYGSTGTFGYKIVRQSEYTFWFNSLSDHLVKLYKSDNLEDSLYFVNNTVEIDSLDTDTVRQVLQKDTIIYQDNTRFRGYTFINPTSMKVFKPTYSDEGMRIDQVFYDNIIYICVYKGKEKLFGQNIAKQDFESLLDSDFYRSVILGDVSFIGVDKDHFYFQAVVEVPNSLIFDLIDVTVSRATSEINFELKNSD